MQVSVHGTILKTLDRCFDGQLTTDLNHKEAMARLWATGKAFNGEYRIKHEESDSEKAVPSTVRARPEILEFGDGSARPDALV